MEYLTRFLSPCHGQRRTKFSKSYAIMGHCLEAQNNMMNMAGYLIITNVGMNGPYLLQGRRNQG